MIKYKVTFCISNIPQVSLIVEALDINSLTWFVDRFYPDTNWDFEVFDSRRKVYSKNDWVITER